MRPSIEYRRLKKLPPILEIDEDGLPISEMELHEGRRWSSEDEETSLRVSDFGADLDD
jgi:hypothetical protein